MDVIVTRVPEENAWTLADLLGRPMGRLISRSDGSVFIRPDGKARRTMIALTKGPHGSVDAALTAIEIHTRGLCRRATEVGRIVGQSGQGDMP